MMIRFLTLFPSLTGLLPRAVRPIPLLHANERNLLRSRRRSVLILVAVAFCVVALVTAQSQTAQAQADQTPDDQVVNVDEIQSIMADEPEEQPQAAKPSGIHLLSLIARGGAFMIPIGLMSLLVVALAVERALSLQRRKLIPPPLVDDMNALANPIDQFNPSVAMRSCDENPSPAARVVTAMLLRTGQPLADIERAATDAIEREADEQAAPIRWLTLAAAATPLMGLLGTVWGMIVAFHESTTLTADRSRSEQLSEGIYTALVTTLAGLIVAIPAAMLALYLENRLAKLFYQLEEFAFEISPGLMRFVGRSRMDPDGTLRPMEPTGNAAPPTAPPPPGVASSSGVAGTTPPPPPREKKKRRGAKAN